jgi:tellurite methyltransferase
MSVQDREKWDEKYRQGSHSSDQPSQIVTDLAPILLPGTSQKRALDVAGGAGRHAIWLAQQGWDATLADISRIAISKAVQRATTLAVSLTTLEIDLEETSFPAGPWDLIIDFHYLSRSLIPRMIANLSVGGLFVMVQPTKRNLERHPKPSIEYLLEEGELPKLLAGLQVIRYEEGWLTEDRHEALFVGRRESL